MTVMKILLVITKSNWGGAQRYVFDLAQALKMHGDDVGVVAGGTGRKAAPSGRLFEECAKIGVRTLFIKRFSRDISLLDELMLFFELLFLFRRERPDVIHMSSSKAGGMGAFAGRFARVPRIIFTSHGLAYDEDRPPLQKFLMVLASWWTFFFCHAVIVISKDTFTRGRHLPLVGRKMHLVHNGRAHPDFFSRDEARRFFAQKIGHDIPPGTLLAGSIAELTKNKALPFLIEAVARTKTPFLYILMGPGEEESVLRALVKEHGLENKFFLLGFVADAARYLCGLDIFTLTSLKEGLPYVIMEAAHAGLPVLSSAIAGSVDMIEEGATGLLVPTKDSNAIVTELERLLADEALRHRLGNTLKKRIEAEFSIERMMRATRALYD